MTQEGGLERQNEKSTNISGNFNFPYTCFYGGGVISSAQGGDSVFFAGSV